MQRFWFCFWEMNPFCRQAFTSGKHFSCPIWCASVNSRGEKASCLSWAGLSFCLWLLKSTGRGKASRDSCLLWESKQVIMITGLLLLCINKWGRKLGCVFQPSLFSVLHWKSAFFSPTLWTLKSPEKDFGQQEKAPSFISIHYSNINSIYTMS